MHRFVTLVFRIRSLLCSNTVSWTRFALTFILYALLTISIGYPIAIFQRISYFKFKFRICIFPTNYLGHFVYEADRYISLNLGKGYQTYFTTQPNIANSYFLKILKQRLKFVPRFLIIPIYIAHHTLPHCSKYVLKIGFVAAMLDEVLVRQTDPWFSIDSLGNSSFESKIYYQGKVKPIVTLFLRDVDFRLRSYNTLTITSSDYRDVNADNYIPFARSLSTCFSIIKMGRGGQYHQGLDDQYWYNYSNSEDQSDVNDFFLTGNSDICVTTDSGSLSIPLLFRKKIVQTNLSLFGLIEGPSSTIVTLKDHRCIASGRLLSLGELVSLGIHRISDQKSFNLLGVEVIENSTEDLYRLAQEVEEIYGGIWCPTKLNEKVNSKMRERFAASFTLPKDTYFANSWISNRTWFFD
jgi:hypothetical protein